MNRPTSPLCSTFADFEGLSRELCDSLLFDETTSDIILRVQEERLPAHRAILGARSPVFQAMFFGSMRERHAREVEISTFAAPTLRLLLRFIYAGRVEGVQLGGMVPLMACADHYGVSALRDGICRYLSESISSDTACTVLALARTYQQEAIQERYLAFILTHAQQVMRTESLMQLDVSVLLRILASDEARIEEVDLFKALVRWYRHWACQPNDARPDEKQAAKLFGSIRYSQMTGQQLVAEVRPLAGDIVPQELYVRALEQVVAPDVALLDDVHKRQAVRRLPPVASIQVSDPSHLLVHSTTVTKVGSAGWNCTAAVVPSTSCTRFTVERLADPQNGIGIAIFDPERNALRGGCGGFPNPSQWGADCLVGVYGTGCFFGIITDHVLSWQVGRVLEITMQAKQGRGTLHVSFESCARAGEVGEGVQAEGSFSVPAGVKLAIALYSPEDTVNIESVW